MAVGFFTKGIDFSLPHPPISQRTILLVCQVIQRAWHLIEEEPPDNFDLQTADEDTITQILVEIVENRLRKSGEVDGFDRTRFGKVIREPKIPNFNKEHPDKMPDIYFDLKRTRYSILSDQDGLFVECKPVDRKHLITSCYCKKGLIRFVNGDYAWAMQEAMMVGYVGKNFTFNKLAAILKKRHDLKTINHSSVNHSVYHSCHEREFEWPDNLGRACHISVAHLWLKV